MISNKKRKNEDAMTAESNKKEKKMIQNSGAFTEIPKNMFLVGDNVFVAVSSYRGKTVLHIRRYKKHGMTYYPTKDGVTMTAWQFEHLFSRPVPVTLLKLDLAQQLLLDDDFEVKSTDFIHFRFTRNTTNKDGESLIKSIVIKLNQWEKIKELLDNVLTTALDYMFRDVDFKTVFEEIEENVIDNTLPSCSDVSNGTEYISRLLYKVMCDLLKENNGLINPTTYDDDIICESNSVGDFNNAALHLDMNEIAIRFREELWSNHPFLTLPPSHYVTIDFLNSVSFDKFIRKAREELCPPCDV